MSPPMPRTVKSTLTINSFGANYRRQGLCFALTSGTWIKFNFRLQMDPKLRTFGEEETHDVQEYI